MDNSSVTFGSWILKRQLGLGGFGDVHLWQNGKTGQNIAIKSLKENPNLSKDEIAKLQQRWQQESKWMNNPGSPFIVSGLNEKVDKQFLAFLTERHAWQPLQPIVMEYCNGGDLRSQLMLVENTNGLIEFEVREVLNALRQAIHFLHTECRIEHRDLKPDNVVIHTVDGQRIYKLTDFGFARTITENTMLKSIVGTRNYVAPEVLDTAEYKKTVDYWSLGIIAFELICGNLPFIPHQSLYEIVTSIRSKTEKCIAITADFPERKYLFHEKFPFENRMSPIFLKRIEEWLTTALDKNYDTRGTRPSPLSKEPVLTFYSDLDSILSQKILNVFYLPTLQFYSWEVTPDMTLREFRDIIKRDIGIENIFCIFPTDHPKPVLSHTYKPIDFFVKEWQDHHNASNAPVMLYITGMKEDYNPPTPEIPSYIKKYLNAKDELPDWLLKFIEQSTHFLLSSEQRYLEAFVGGLKEYALTMEHSILQYDTDNKTSKLQQYYNALVEMCGRVDQFCMNIEAAKQTCPTENRTSNCFFEEWCSRAKKVKDDFAILEELRAKVNRYYKSGLRRAKEMANNTIFDDLKNKDVYKLIDFRRHLETVQKIKINGQERLSVCRTAVYDCLDQRQKIVINGIHLKYAYATITSVQEEFTLLQSIVDTSLIKLNEMRKILSLNTKDFHTKLFDVYKSARGQCTYLAQDGVSPILLNGNSNMANSINELFQYPVHSLIEDATEMMIQMDIDENVNKIDDLPATINE